MKADSTRILRGYLTRTQKTSACIPGHLFLSQWNHVSRLCSLLALPDSDLLEVLICIVCLDMGRLGSGRLWRIRLSCWTVSGSVYFMCNRLNSLRRFVVRFPESGRLLQHLRGGQGGVPTKGLGVLKRGAYRAGRRTKSLDLQTNPASVVPKLGRMGEDRIRRVDFENSC